MKFTKAHKVIISTLTKEEAVVFTHFLEDEIARHKKCIEEADFMWTMRSIIGEVYESASARHQLDIDNTTDTLNKVEELFNL